MKYALFDKGRKGNRIRNAPPKPSKTQGQRGILTRRRTNPRPPDDKESLSDYDASLDMFRLEQVVERLERLYWDALDDLDSQVQHLAAELKSARDELWAKAERRPDDTLELVETSDNPRSTATVLKFMRDLPASQPRNTVSLYNEDDIDGLV